MQIVHWGAVIGELPSLDYTVYIITQPITSLLMIGSHNQVSGLIACELEEWMPIMKYNVSKHLDNSINNNLYTTLLISASFIKYETWTFPSI